MINGEGRYVAENITYTPSVIIRDNCIETIPTRGILCTTRQTVLIEGNSFHELYMAAIFISNDSADWYESGPVRNMIIRGNRFYLRKKEADSRQTEAVLIAPVVLQTEDGHSCKNIHQNILISDNTFFADSAQVIRAEGVTNLTFVENHIRSRKAFL